MVERPLSIEIEENYPEIETININPITKDVANCAIRKLQNGKAGGVDMITQELLKSDKETSTNKLHIASSAIFGIKKNTMRLEERFDCEFTKERRRCRALKLEGIALLPIVSEVLGRVVINRIKAGIDEILGPEQAGFREGKSTTEQIFILRNIIE